MGYEYQDVVKARKWFDASTPEADAYRALHDASRGGRGNPIEIAAAAKRMDDIAQQATDLLAAFGLALTGCGIGVEAIPLGLLRRPDQAMRDYLQRQEPDRDTSEWTYDPLHVVRLDGNAWTWLRPLLEELRELRARTAFVHDPSTSTESR